MGAAVEALLEQPPALPALAASEEGTARQTMPLSSWLPVPLSSRDPRLLRRQSHLPPSRGGAAASEDLELSQGELELLFWLRQFWPCRPRFSTSF